jgi:GAF domain-containing protein
MGHARPFAYSETDVIVFQQLTDHLATAIENATLYAKSRRGAYNEALVNNIAVRLQQQGDIEDMLHITASDLGKALGARRARIRLGTGQYVATMPSVEVEPDEDARIK